jgi:3-hydroxyacyl-CoA dehydrogenase / enoyl-CoA hydratase / 3-hydroxybutyryl-CoA epimerase
MRQPWVRGECATNDSKKKDGCQSFMTMQTTERKHRLDVVRRESGVALIMFDAAGRHNSVGSDTIAELNDVLDVIESDSSIKAVVGISGKPESFIVGADLQEIRKAEGAGQLRQLSLTGQTVLNKMSTFAKPFVCAINGACLGGGLEIALATHARIVSCDPKTVLGLPETKLGLIPGCGGTQRLPRLVGLKIALDMILSGSTLSAERALQIGLVDELVAADNLIAAAEKKALALIDSGEWREIVRRNHSYLEEKGQTAGGCCLKDLSSEKAEKLLAIWERVVKLRTRGNYPAQIEAIKVMRAGLTRGFVEGLAAEADAFASLASGEVAANLITLFLNTDLAKTAAQALVNKFAGSEVKTLGIIGAGTMGAGIARLAATRGSNVVLKTGSDRLEQVRDEMHQLLERSAHEDLDNRAAAEIESERTLQDFQHRLLVVDSFAGLSGSDMIIECIVEDQPAKAKTLARLFEYAGADCVVASNTSALSISELSASCANPENFLGVHFFHPVDRMPLVELIVHDRTSKAALARATDLVLKMEKTPLVVKDSPGFLINRLLTVYLFELARLAQEQTPLNWIEEALLAFGMPVGPLQLMDEIGLDLAFSVARRVEVGLGARMKSPEIFQRSCAAGMQGKSGNAGFYLWENHDRKLAINPAMLEKLQAVTSEEKCSAAEKTRIADRMVLTMADEAARCLEEKVVSRPREVDFALILGIGFPAFRGGVLKYADQRGLADLVVELEKIYAFTKRAGSAADREVSPLLRKYAQEGRGFYSLNVSRNE